MCYEIHCTEGKMSEDKLITSGKRATGRSSSYEKRKKENKDKVCGENARENLIQKLEFIQNRWYFQIFMSLISSEIECNFFHIS